MTIASEWPLPWRLTCSIASSSESTTPTAIFRSRYSVSQSSAVAAPHLDAAGVLPGPLVAEQLDPGLGQVGEDPRAGRRARPARRPAASRPELQTPGPVDLGVEGDRPRHLEVGVGVHVDVAVARRPRTSPAPSRRPSAPPSGPRRRAGSGGRRRRPGSPARRGPRGRRPASSTTASSGSPRRRAPRGRSPARAPLERSA